MIGNWVHWWLVCSVFLQFWSQLNNICKLIFLNPITPDLRCLQCYPAKLFPTRYRAFAHGISAASGKVGAIISASAFSTLSNKVGTPTILWSKFPMPYCFASGFLMALFDLMNSLLWLLRCRGCVQFAAPWSSWMQSWYYSHWRNEGGSCVNTTVRR